MFRIDDLFQHKGFPGDPGEVGLVVVDETLIGQDLFPGGNPGRLEAWFLFIEIRALFTEAAVDPADEFHYMDFIAVSGVIK
ncbi:MAG: hypothetical protein JXA13_01550 [Anaerolineales bacterium]|nr:hypothetical protein [Anaerolineales bacterium]